MSVKVRTHSEPRREVGKVGEPAVPLVAVGLVPKDRDPQKSLPFKFYSMDNQEQQNMKSHRTTAAGIQ